MVAKIMRKGTLPLVLAGEKEFEHEDHQSESEDEQLDQVYREKSSEILNYIKRAGALRRQRTEFASQLQKIQKNRDALD
jgi:hypothetical protein